MKHADDSRVVAGDRVELEQHGDGPATISRVRERSGVLARRAAAGSTGGGARRSQPIAANVDQVVVVAATRDPELHPRMLDRFLVIAAANGLPAAVIVNKVELDRGVADALARRYAPAGYQVLATSVKAPEGLVALRDLLRGRETVFTGASGVGKSSLLNARAGVEAAYRSNQREVAHRKAHHPSGGARSSRPGWLCGRHTRDAGSECLGDRARRTGRLFSGFPALSGPLPVRQLPAPGRARVRGACRGRGG